MERDLADKVDRVEVLELGPNDRLVVYLDLATPRDGDLLVRWLNAVRCDLAAWAGIAPERVAIADRGWRIEALRPDGDLVGPAEVDEGARRV